MATEVNFLGLNEVSAVVLTALVAALVAVWGVMSQRNIAARQATILHLARWEADRELLRARTAFSRAAAVDGGLAVWAAESKSGSQEFQDILTVLNEYELTAVGLQRGILDREIFERICRQRTINDWKLAEGFVSVLKQRVDAKTEQSDKLFQEFRDLSEMLSGSKQSKRSYFWSRFF